ncbi:MAG: helix-turn-helix transcriptional regulator [Leptolyngbyaceae cyanobacterium SM1_4_3]|nr:helix-turn-helix transcriptional regulator [Leptolyngbyaceae cyanobacterium SM1_4_3]
MRTRRRSTRIDEPTLDALCKVLSCQPGDLMVYEEQNRGHGHF